MSKTLFDLCILKIKFLSNHKPNSIETMLVRKLWSRAACRSSNGGNPWSRSEDIAIRSERRSTPRCRPKHPPFHPNGSCWLLWLNPFSQPSITAHPKAHVGSHAEYRSEACSRGPISFQPPRFRLVFKCVAAPLSSRRRPSSIAIPPPPISLLLALEVPQYNPCNGAG